MQAPNGGVPAHNGERCARLTHGARSNHVIETAIRLFAQKGFQGTKTKEIAEAAGVNEALIFRDFQTKENLYCAILDYASDRIGAAGWIEELSPYRDRRDDRALFSRLALRLFETFGREHALFRLMVYCALEHHELARKFREALVEPLERFIEDYLRLRQEEGAFRPADPHALGRCFLHMCHHHVLRQVLFGDQAQPAADAAAAKVFTEIFLEGARKKHAPSE
jgi:AcrR family transcriptional regulator